MLERFNRSSISKILLYGITVMLFSGSLFFSGKFIQISKDKPLVDSRNFSEITGIVVDYAKTRSSGDIATDTIYIGPHIKDDISGEIIILDVAGTKLNYKYKFIYLPHSKLAVIVTEYGIS